MLILVRKLKRLQFRLRGQRKLAEFSFAGVVAYADDERTGNLVPDGEEIPSSANGRKRQVAAYSNSELRLTDGGVGADRNGQVHGAFIQWCSIHLWTARSMSI